MREQEFREAIRECADSFGADRYPASTIDAIWKLVQTVSIGEFRLAIDACSNYGAPTLAKIRKEIAPAVNRARSAEKESRLDSYRYSGGNCPDCGYSGFIVAFSRENPFANYSFRCPNCNVSSIVGTCQSIPFWDKDYTEKYMMVPHGDFMAGMTEVKVARADYIRQQRGA